MGLFGYIFGYIARAKKEPKVYIDDKGYYRFKDTDKLVHRWAAEKKLGRRLKVGEVVHHINRNKHDNSPDNLQVFPNQQAHDELHKIDALNFGKEFSYMGRRKRLTLYYIFIGWWNN